MHISSGRGSSQHERHNVADKGRGKTRPVGDIESTKHNKTKWACITGTITRCGLSWISFLLRCHFSEVCTGMFFRGRFTQSLFHKRRIPDFLSEQCQPRRKWESDGSVGKVYEDGCDVKKRSIACSFESCSSRSLVFQLGVVVVSCSHAGQVIS